MPITERIRMMADDAGLRVEMVGGLPVWEVSPVIKHQIASDRIRRSIHRSRHNDSDCACVHFADIEIRFPDGSQKRPDIAVFCRTPDEEAEEVTLVPEAVIEILSKGYEAKDLKIGVPFYQSQGVKDIVVFNPYSLEVFHFHGGQTMDYVSPVTIQFECGCECVV